MFALRDVHHAYDGKTVLSVPQWQAEQGAQWLMLGPSGSGKTTLLHVLAGILRPSSGQVSVAGQDLGALSASALDHFRGKHIGIVLQRLHLIDSLSVIKNLLLAQYLAGQSQDAGRVREVLASLDLADKANARPHELSFGQAQRVAVARAVVNKPKLLLADEPTSNLDDARCMQVLDLLLTQAKACGATLVIATHDQRIKARVPNQFELGAARV
ncbi:MAG: ATP-binding cassette domain-containing protein [Betaproteobacteria bacterium]|nr:ATP-binding cassette domain-containing protein [Betaproteobacteria bacterium]